MNDKRGVGATASAIESKPGRRGKTDWAKLKQQSDADVKYTKDAPETAPEDWAHAIAHRGLPVPAGKQQIALRVDADVLDWYKAQGRGWQTRMNQVLKAFRDAHGG